jgi:hypothetical protein
MRLDLLTLPITSLTYLQESGIWNISKIEWGKDNKNYQVLNDGSLKVFYPKGSYSLSKFPQSGIRLYTSPKNIFPTEDIIFSYDVKFDETFQSVLGGKLPGLFFSEGTAKKYIRESNTTSSLRILWQKDFDVEAHVYLPENQSQEYQHIPNLIKNNTFGDSLWRGIFKFQPTKWNKVMMRVKMNTFDKNGNANANGILEIFINEQLQKFTKLIWSTNPSTKITAILLSTFFGGSSEEYATPVDTWSYFKNFRINKI